MNRDNTKMLQTPPYTLPISLLLLLLSITASAQELQKAGTVTLAIGQVTALASNTESRPLSRGEPIYVGDKIQTGVNGHLHLRFIDDAAISVRPDSRLHIESYHYNPSQHNESAIRFKLEEGVVRSISGKAAEAAHDRFRLNTPITAIGVLGTDFVVRVKEGSMWAAVYSGAIAVAPLDEGCVENGLGACPGAALLSEDMGNIMLEFQARNGQIKLKSYDNQVLPQTEDGTASDQITASEQVGSQIVSDVESGVLSAPPMAWGRWHGGAWEGDTISTPYNTAMEGRHVTIGSKNYALFRTDTTLPELVPEVGRYNFTLQQGQVHFVEQVKMWEQPDISPASLDEAALQIDFQQRQFTTELKMSHPQQGAAELSLTGNINSNGIFTASDAAGMAAGALTLDGSRAGMLFDQRVDGGSFTGITDWAR